MSFDFDTMPTSCDHYQIKERMLIDDTDLRTLVGLKIGSRMRAPINGKSTFKLRINGKNIPASHDLYGWTISDDELSIYPEKKSKIVFNKQVRLNNALIELEYVTIKAYCRKCIGKDQVVDIKKSVSGSIQKIKDQRKLVQRVYKYVLTSRCYFYPELTCQIKEFVGRKFGLSLTNDDISYEITNSLSKMKKVQEQQAQIQKLTQLEVLRDIRSVDVQRSETNPTLVSVGLEVLNFSNETSKLNFGIKVQ
jgi:hypothetical protein